jgi:hypothetical protein
MARIPLGNFGNQIAQPGGRVNVNPAAFTAGAEAVQRAAGQVMNVLEQQQAEEQRQQQLLDRAKAANSVLDREMQVDAIHGEISQQVADGTIHYSDAKNAYSQRIQELGAPDVKGLDPVTAENLTKGFKRVEFKGENAIEGLVIKSKTADFRAQTDGILDKLGKQAGLPGSDMATLGKQLDAMDEIGRQAYGAAWDKRKQDWKDNSWDAKLNQQAMVARDNLQGITTLQKQITEGDYADKLDSNRRNVLVAKLDGYKTSLIQRQEAAAARAERIAERQLKKAEAEFNTFQGLADKGTILSPEYIDRAVAATKGTPYQAGIVALARQAQETGGIAAQPIRNQEATLTQLDTLIAKNGRTPELDKRREQVSRVLEASRRDLNENGLRAGLERGVITEMAPLDTSTPESFAASISKRLEQADQVGMWAGRAVSPLDANEAASVRNMLDALPPKQKSQAVATLAQSVGPRAAGAIALQLDKQDKPLALAFAHAGDKTTAGRYTSELLLKGATAIKDGAVMKDDKKVTGWKATIAQQIDGALPDERAASAVKESAYYIAAGIAAEKGGSVGGDDIARAVRLAVGGSIIERNGKKLPIPAGMDDSEFENRLKNVPASDILKQAPEGKVRVGGTEMNVADFATTVPGQELIYAGPGRYAVIVKGRPVTNAAGKPIIIGVQ